jgi:hypothetical protein
MPNLLENTPKVSDKTIMTDYVMLVLQYFTGRIAFLILGVGDRIPSFRDATVMPNLLGNAPMVSDKSIMTDYDAGFVSK